MGRAIAARAPAKRRSRALGSQVPEKAKHYGIATVLPEPVDPSDTLVLQYDLKISNGLTCGGAYLKFLTADASFSASDLKDDSPYSVMFGPDKCGSTNKASPRRDRTHLCAPAIDHSHRSHPRARRRSLAHAAPPALHLAPAGAPDPAPQEPQDWVHRGEAPQVPASRRIGRPHARLHRHPLPSQQLVSLA